MDKHNDNIEFETDGWSEEEYLKDQPYQKDEEKEEKEKRETETETKINATNKETKEKCKSMYILLKLIILLLVVIGISCLYKFINQRQSENITQSRNEQSKTVNESIQVISLEDIELGNQSIEVTKTEDDKLVSLKGDFGDTYASSEKEALVILNAYKTVFNIEDETITFKINIITGTTQTRTYLFEVYLGDFLINNSNASIIVDSATDKVIEISINIADISKIKDFIELDYEAILRTYIETNNEDIANTDYILSEGQSIIDNNEQIKIYYISFKNGTAITAHINCITGEVHYSEIITTEQTIDYYE